MADLREAFGPGGDVCLIVVTPAVLAQVAAHIPVLRIVTRGRIILGAQAARRPDRNTQEVQNVGVERS